VSVELDGRGGATSKELKETIPDAVMQGHGSELFDFVAELVKRANPPAGVPLGFTFSFPVDQKSLDSGELIQWTKGCVTCSAGLAQALLVLLIPFLVWLSGQV
jgi:hexokinase